MIDHKDFFADVNLIRSDQFTVVSVPKPYDVKWDKNENPFDSVLKVLNSHEKNLLIIDAKLLEVYQPNLNEISPDRIFVTKASENFKTLDTVTKILDFLQRNQFTKGEKLVVVGGGITQDISAFVGAVYKRGIAWVLFPTTLLAMCDSCIGGNAGVNYNGVKNQLALFSAPSEIIINPNFLKTLTENEINSGLGEILKLCIIGGDYFIKLYQNNVTQGKLNSFDSFKPLILAALCIKKSVVEIDEFELNHRRSLNYGHTLGHAIESLSHYDIPHGQAVVVGMLLVNELSHAQGLLSSQDLASINHLCLDLINEQVQLCLHKINLENVIDLIKRDKKTVGQYTSFVLMKALGDTRLVKLELNDDLLNGIRRAYSSLIRNCLPI